MNNKEAAITEYLNQLQLHITDPTQKQQDYYETIKQQIIISEHKIINFSDPQSPYSLREIYSPAHRCSTLSLQSPDIDSNHHRNGHHNHHRQLHQLSLHINTIMHHEKKVEI